MRSYVDTHNHHYYHTYNKQYKNIFNGTPYPKQKIQLACKKMGIQVGKTQSKTQQKLYKTNFYSCNKTYVL